MWNQDLSVLISMPFDGASSEGERYGAGQRQLSPGRFKKGSENPERIEKYWNQQQSRIFFIKESIHETWKRLEGSLLYERFFVYIFIPLLVGFLSRSSTLYQVLSPGILYESNFDIFVRFITRNPLDFPS